MYKTKTIKHEIDVTLITDVICNSCGEACKGFRNQDGGMEAECVTVDKTWGYFSGKDMVRQVAHLCEDCWDSLTENWKVPPTEMDRLGWDCDDMHIEGESDE